MRHLAAFAIHISLSINHIHFTVCHLELAERFFNMGSGVSPAKRAGTPHLASYTFYVWWAMREKRGR